MSCSKRLVLASFLCVNSVSAAQHIGLPAPIPAGLDELVVATGTPQLSADEGLPGAALSPDGRLGLFAVRNGCDQDGGWYVSVLKHESMVVNPTTGHPRFAHNGALEAWSSPKRIGEPAAFMGPPRVLSSQNPMWQLTWVAMAPDPAFSHLPNPFPSDQLGAYVPGPSSPAFATYQMLLVAADTWAFPLGAPTTLQNPQLNYYSGSCLHGGPETVVNPIIGSNPPWATMIPKPAPNANCRTANPIGMRTLKVVVKDPGTAIASIHSTDLSSDFRVLQFTPTGGGAPRPLLGIEPTLTLDGRLLIFQGNTTTMNANWANNVAQNGHILYSWNPNPGQQFGWSEPRSIADLYNHPAVGALRPRELYPIARNPLYSLDGAALTGNVSGAYPWVTLDGSDVAFTTVARNAGRLFGVSLLGSSTHWRMRHIDGPINPSRDHASTPRRILTGTGMAPGAWAWGGQNSSLPLPFAPAERTLPMISANRRTYVEVPLDAGLDRDILLALDMNECLTPPTAGLSWNFDLTRTPNTAASGPTRWPLLGGAYFASDELDSPGPYVGRIGECVKFPGAGHVSANHPDLNQPRQSLTVSMWVKQDAGSPGPRPVLAKGTDYQLLIDASGQVQASVAEQNGTPHVSSWRPTPALSKWTHLALVFDGRSTPKKASLWVDGAEAWSVPLATSNPQLAGSNTPLVVGPNGVQSAVGALYVDQLRIDGVARDAREIARLAYVPEPAAQPTAPVPGWMHVAISALGRDASMVRLDAGQPLPTPALIALGEKIFHDSGISPAGRSCATCHMSVHAFTDTLAKRPSLLPQGPPLRNAPTVLDRLWSTVQEWDGGAVDLRAQAQGPILSPHEMGSNEAFVLARLANQPYPPLFTAAFGSPTPKFQGALDALAAYQRALISTPSRADQFEAGTQTLTLLERDGRNLFFGKARCFACHHGPNFSDEQFHVTVAKHSDDAGRFEVTGRQRDSFRFKTPTLRQLSLTAPYFHDGSADTLTDVVNAYVSGGHSSSTVVDEEIFPLTLTSSEVTALVAYLSTLNSTFTRL